MTMQVYFWLLITLIICDLVISDDYYSVIHVGNGGFSQTEGEQFCNQYGKHLASIHATSQNIDVMTMSKTYQCEACWIGMEIEIINNSPKISWTDKFNVDSSFINMLWCAQYPMINYNKTNTTYYVYIDVNQSCWKSTTKSSSAFCIVCGPQMFDTSGIYWISNVLIPLIGAGLALPYSLYCIIYLIYHLYKFEHSWILYPTTYIKVTGILIPCMVSIIFILASIYSIMLYIAWHKTGIMAPSSPLDSHYPYIYRQIAIIQGVTVGLLYIYIPLGYIHLLSRLKHTFDHNEYMQEITFCKISWKCCYRLIIILIIFYFMVFPVLEIVNVTVNGANSNDSEGTIKMVIVGIGIVSDILINTLLSCLYVKGLHEYSDKHYFRMDIAKANLDTNIIDDRRHELMLEATRYTVLFSFVWILNLMAFLCIIIFYFVGNQYFMKIDPYGLHNKFQNTVSIVVTISLYLKELALLIAIRLSFKFSHKRYERVCKKCDQCIKDCCHAIVRRKNAKIIQQYKVSQSKNSNISYRPLLSDHASQDDQVINGAIQMGTSPDYK